ncbi:hypothetical protein E3U43_001650 [Scomber scombrus]|uniref:Uncharacterized protein n=1 Tax=Scomber scombrus TaxID=13677 RepID=A0AAV1Q328_SCOSC
MGLCTSKSTVTLDPSAHTLRADQASWAVGEGVSPEGTPILDEGILMVQPVKSKAEGGGGGGSRLKSGSVDHPAVNQIAKGYLELGGKVGGDMEAQTSREGEEEDEDEEGDEVEELINFSESEQSSCGPIPNHCGRLYEFNILVERFGHFVTQNCSEGSSTNRSCQYNATVSQGGCTLDGFFIQGLRSLNSITYVKRLQKKLEYMNTECKHVFNELSLECGGDDKSLVTFYNQLKNLKERLNDHFAVTKK